MNSADISLWVAVPAALLMVMAGLLALIGSVGLLRLPDFYRRLHAPTLGSTLGALFTLLASMLLASAAEGRPVLHELLIGLFLVLGSPITTMLLMRAAIYRNVPHGEKNQEAAGDALSDRAE
jgi:multicomponent K+:H+ antiporter subunit G